MRVILEDLGSVPANEECAQLGRDPHFDYRNMIECQVYRAALLAFAGLPPKGLFLDIVENRHDFGTYRTVAFRSDPRVATKSDIDRYYELIENRPNSWIALGFNPVLDDNPGELSIEQAVKQRIDGAISITRPNASGDFFPASTKLIHVRLLEQNGQGEPA